MAGSRTGGSSPRVIDADGRSDDEFLRRWMAQYDVVAGRWEGLTGDEPRRRTRVPELELATAAAGSRAVPLSLER